MTKEGLAAMVFIANNCSEFPTFSGNVARESLGASVCFYVEEANACNDLAVLGFEEFTE
ncbi:hypothetical protein D3C86_2025380 [compost metagenome]